MRSIKSRLLVWLLLGQAALLVVVDTATWRLGSGVIEGGFNDRVATDVRAIGSLLSQAGPDLELEFSDELMPQYLPGPSPAYFEVWVDGVGVLERSISLHVPPGERPNGQSPIKSDLPRKGGSVENPLAWDLILPGDVAGRAVGIHFPVHEYKAKNQAGMSAPRATATIVVAVDRSQLDRHLSQLRVGIITLDLALVIVSALVVLAGVHLALKPVQRIADDLGSALTSGDAIQVSWKNAPLELKPMKDAFLLLLVRVDDAYQREKRLAGNIAHELRTPIAELRAAADVALMKRGDLAAMEEAVLTSHAIAGEMESVVLTLLRIWRARVGGERESDSAIQPLDLLHECVGAHQALGGERAVTVKITGDSKHSVDVPEEALELALGNLVRNAMEHAVAGTEVECSVSQDREGTTLVVRNQQAGLVAQDASVVGEPFWSRSETGREAGNSGLGLALVEALSDACGFHLELEIESEEGGDPGGVSPGWFTASLRISPSSSALGREPTD